VLRLSQKGRPLFIFSEWSNKTENFLVIALSDFQRFSIFKHDNEIQKNTVQTLSR